MTKETRQKGTAGGVFRRDFIICSGTVVVGEAVGAINGAISFARESVVEKHADVLKEATKEAPMVFPIAEAYLVVDQSECA
jgi:hypothetical protein